MKNEGIVVGCISFTSFTECFLNWYIYIYNIYFYLFNVGNAIFILLCTLCVHIFEFLGIIFDCAYFVCFWAEC